MSTISRIAVSVAALILAGQAWSGDFQAGMNAFNSADYEKALAEWQPLADAGDADGQYGLGMLYGNGFGVDMNDEKALHYYNAAADQGHADAQYKLGVMHQNGWGVPMDEKAAADIFRKAAEKGHIEAQMGLAQICAAEWSPMYDKIEAYKWFSIATQLGNMNAAVAREDLANDLTADEVIEIDGIVNIWMEDHGALVAIDE